MSWQVLRHVLSVRGGDHASGLRPARPWTLSLGLFLAFLAIGWSSLPAGVRQNADALRLHDPRGGASGVAPAVFALRADGAAVRFGNAEAASGGAILVGLYDPLDPLLFNASEAVSLPSDPRLLWLLASPAERQTLRDQTASLTLSLPAALLAVLRSPEFAADYRDRLLRILEASLQEAWQASQASGAVDDLLHGYEPILRDVAARQLRPMIERYFQSVAIRMLGANALTLVDPFSTRQWDSGPLEQALRAVVLEIRDREIPQQTMLRLLDAPQTTVFLRVFFVALGDRLAHNPALQDLFGELVFDARLHPYFDEAIARAGMLGRTAPRLVVSLHGSADLNLVASTAVRSLFAGREERVVVFMSPAQRAEIMALDPAAVHPLDQPQLR